MQANYVYRNINWRLANSQIPIGASNEIRFPVKGVYNSTLFDSTVREIVEGIVN